MIHTTTHERTRGHESWVMSWGHGSWVMDHGSWVMWVMGGLCILFGTFFAPTERVRSACVPNGGKPVLFPVKIMDPPNPCPVHKI